MQVTALAEALVRSRRPDGTFSFHDLELWLARAGLDELACAVASLSGRPVAKEEMPGEHDHPWF